MRVRVEGALRVRSGRRALVLAAGVGSAGWFAGPPPALGQTTMGVVASRPDPEDPSVLLSELDNPVLIGQYQLRPSITGPMFTQVPLPFAWEHFRYDLYTATGCDALDPFCVANPDFGVGSTSAPIGPQIDDPQPPYELFSPQRLPYLVRGIRIGYEAADIRLRELVETSATTTATQEAAAIRVALDPTTLLVPVNVVVALPSAAFPGPRAQIAPLAHEEYYRTLFDDRHLADHLRAPDGVYEGHWNWTVFSVPAPPVVPGLDYREVQRVVAGGDVFSAVGIPEIGLQPDSVFSQCGIQFRMAEFSIFNENDGTRVWMTTDGTPTGPPLCAGQSDLTIRGKLRSLKTEAAAALTDPDLPMVIIGYRASNPDCQGFAMGVAESRSYAFLSIANNRTENTNTLVHELGHLLGMDHTESDTTCNTAESTNIMCANPRSTARHIPGCEIRDGQLLSPLPRNCQPLGDSFPQASCSLARSVAGSLSDSSPPNLELGPDQTVECTSPQGAAVTVTAVASDPQSGITQVNFVPSPASVSGPKGETATFNVSIGVPTVVTARAFNGASQVTTDTATLTVVDSVPPVIAAAPPVNVTMCNADQSVTIAAPTVGDTCSVGLVAVGSIVEQDGQPLSTPIPLTNGTATLAAGTYVIQWVAADTAGNDAVPVRQTVMIAACVGAAGAMKIADRARLETASGRPLQVVNHGDGLVEIGVESRVGSIASVGSVALRDRAVVDGSIRTSGTIMRSKSATVTGAMASGVPVLLASPPTITNPWPATSNPGFSVEPSTTRSIGPGSYGSVSVKSNGTLLLSTGTYYFTALGLEPQGKIRVRSATVLEVKAAYIHRGAYVNDAGVLTEATLRYRGTSGAFLESSFLGSALAPNADLVLGGSSGARYEGTFFGKNLEVRPDVPVTVPATVAVSLIDPVPIAPGGSSEGTSLPAEEEGAFAELPVYADAPGDDGVGADAGSGGCAIAPRAGGYAGWLVLGVLAGALRIRGRSRRRCHVAS